LGERAAKRGGTKRGTPKIETHSCNWAMGHRKKEKWEVGKVKVGMVGVVQ